MMALFREIGLPASTFLVIGNIIGIGIYTTSGLIVGEISESPWLIGVWLVGGGLALVGAACYARLGVKYPRAGGEYAFLRPAFGPLPAFLSGWASLLIGFTAPIAASALGLAHYMEVYLPEQFHGSPGILRIIAVSTLILVSALVGAGLKAGSKLHSVVTVLNVAVVLLFSVLVLYKPGGENHLPEALSGTFLPSDLPALASAIVLVMFTFSGWNAAAYIAGEIRDPSRNIPRALIIGTTAVTVSYVLINLAYLSAVPTDELSGKIAVAEAAALASFGPVGQHLVNVLILFSILSSLTAMAIAGPRVYYAMAEDRLFPQWLSSVNSRRKVPLRAIWFQTLIAILFICVGDLYQILLYSGFVLMLFSTLTVATLLKAPRGRFLPLFFVLVNSLVLISATFSNPVEALVGAATVILGLPVYYYFKGRAVPR